VCGTLTAGKCNRMDKSLKMAVSLKVNDDELSDIDNRLVIRLIKLLGVVN